MKFFARVPNINFMAQRKLGLAVSAVLTVAAILLVAIRGLNLGIDFTGGVLVEVEYPQSVELDTVRRHLAEAGYERAVVQYFGSTTAVLIRLPPAENASSAQVSTNILRALHAEESGISLRRIEFVGPQVGEELAEKGGLALLFAFIGIMVYIAFRFEWKFSVGAIAALVHDAVMVLGYLALLQVEFDITTLAAILALIGYSNNETIVIFDRVRENLIHQRRTDILDVINLSVNQTLLRSVITHLTTLLVLFALLLLGGPSVHSFSVALIFGVIVATYSSIYISTNLAVALGVSREDLLPPEDKELGATL
ncbi:protein translocase subunit secF [Fontimonas thermophila]|uniref:Protein-export membrane protein SecF n=2 Tax=Fontimonas thermophila TaxID=1076937 RepID=A0A1I2IJF1_9GAMM|nr:protein translocase subunit secF [Fontimonas thermophila]